MATTTKARGRSGSGKGGRRPQVKVKRGNDVPLLPIAVAAILVVFAIGLIIYFMANNKSTAPQTAGGIPCDQLEHTQIHYHAALQIVYQGNVLPIPAYLGIVTNPVSGTTTCFYWLHVHGANPNVIHIESPATDTFTLAQFFSVWSTWNKAQGLQNEPHYTTHLSALTLTPPETLLPSIDLPPRQCPSTLPSHPNAIL